MYLHAFEKRSVPDMQVKTFAIEYLPLRLGGQFWDRLSRPRPWARLTVVDLAHGRG